ncbi:cation diffusion facilitator family transporter [Paenalkalicoccus suaedae]|uniref:Cation diffusion facilitator family transporter n=1 Tax=Paenalkalicoccus suaedae TaxID=2592382 RepID=A0A859FGQ6_9BACI|nr:cation diffusion facilitator family transporter [Paenalkalicoccus suaedae]QKS72309.1 cation diffusion facilitator family transporter [Paenalkalicoccus suaedae]
MERNMLILSVVAAVVFSVSGIIFGLLFQSQIILFDGLYSLVSVALSFASLAAASFIAKADWDRFPYGKDMIQPLVILIKYTVILLLVVGSLIAAIVAVATGGRDIALGPTVIYSTIGMLACLGFFLYIKRKSAKTSSAFVRAEANQWLLDTMVSVGVFVGFIIAIILAQIPATAAVVPYVDPIMVIIVSIYFLKFPLVEMRIALREVLDMTPAGETTQKLSQLVKKLEHDHKINESFVRVSKVGKTLWVEIDFVVSTESDVQTVMEQDRIREELSTYLDRITEQKWLTVSFTGDRKWAVE